jgi:PAS domain-containing protein
VNVFRPADLEDILCELQNKQVYREVSIEDRVFGEAIHFVPQFGVVRFYIYDMTERKRAADSLNQSEARYRGLFEHMLEGVAFCHMLFYAGDARDFVYLGVNEAFQTLTGLEDVVGKRATEVIPGIRERDPELRSTPGWH